MILNNPNSVRVAGHANDDELNTLRHDLVVALEDQIDEMEHY